MIDNAGDANGCFDPKYLVDHSLQEMDGKIADIRESCRKKGIDVNTCEQYNLMQRMRRSAFISLNTLMAMGSSVAEIKHKCQTLTLEMRSIDSALSQGMQTAESGYLQTNAKHTAFTTTLLEIDASKLLLTRNSRCSIKVEGPEFNAAVADAKSYTKKYCANLIKESYGKPAALAFKVGAQMALGHIPDTENPRRDLIISSVVAVGVGEVMSMIMQRSPAYAALATSNIAYDISCRAQKGLAFLACQEGVEEMWNYQALLANEGPQFASSLVMANGIATIGKIPGELLQTVQRVITNVVASFADNLGITEKNIADMTNHAFEQIAVNNPELFEDIRTWG